MNKSLGQLIGILLLILLTLLSCRAVVLSRQQLVQPEQDPAPEEPLFSWTEDGSAGALCMEEAVSVQTPAPVLPGLETVEHRPYLSGNNDRINPDGTLSRAETAQILYSLLEYQPELTGSVAFPDVEEGAWYGPAVLALAEMGVIGGQDDGSFQPGQAMTRREFVLALTRFFDVEGETVPQAGFEDVSRDSPGAEAIDYAAAQGWLWETQGAFRPEDPITRAEMVCIINKALGRQPDGERLQADGYALVFVDLPFTHWAYADFMEATLEHTHTEEGGWASYTVPAAAHGPGSHLIDGELYHADENGRWVRNQSIGVLSFGDDGRYTTGDEQLDGLLTDFVKAHTVEGDSNYNNYQRLHEYLSTLPYRGGSYLDDTDNDGQTGWELEMALDMLENEKGNCYRYAGLGALLARRMGYQAVGVSGTLDNHTGNGAVLHGWVEIALDGETYVCDPQQQFRFPEKDLFMKKYSQMEEAYWVGGELKE